MRTPRYIPVTRVTALLVLALLMFDFAVARAQQTTHPWSGIAADDARPAHELGQSEPFTTELAPRSLSRDGRFVVFASRAALVASDTNSDWDIYLRDRQTNDLSRVSVALDGGDANGLSSWPSISPDARYVAFLSAASNLVADDTNGLPDNFVFDREQQTIVRVNVGPNGEQSLSEAGLVSISADGRYSAFSAIFEEFAPAPQAWLRDRDADGNGIFDEPGLTTTTELPAPTPSGTEQFFGFGWMILSGDARFVSFNPLVYTQDWQPLGTRLYIHDRVAGTTMLIGEGSVLEASTVIEATEPDFSDTGHLVYATNAPNLVPDDSDVDMDVFVVNLFTGGHTRLQLTHAAAPTLAEARSPAVSSEGRFVTFVGTELTPGGISLRDVYAVDRESGLSYEVSVRPDGARATRVGDYPSISDDGSAIAFLAGSDMLVEGCCYDGVFVATAVSMSPDTITLSPDGETVFVELNAPANTAWDVRTIEFSDQLFLLQVSPASGAGREIITLSLPPNHSAQDREYWVIVGSERVILRQRSSPEVWFLSPQAGSITGGTEVMIIGNGFAPDATVEFAGRPATNVVVENTSVIRLVTPGNDMPGPVDVVVRNGDGQTATFGFVYLDEPAVEVQSVSGVFGGSVQLQATLRGTNGPISDSHLEFFVSNVRVGQSMTNAAGQATLLLPLGNRSVGSYPVRVTFAGNGDAMAASGDGTLSIVRAPLTIRVNDASKYFGEMLPTFTATGVGFVNGDTLATLSGTLGFTTHATATSGVGTYAVTPGGLSSPNYTITFVNGTLTIIKAATTLNLSSTPNPSRNNQVVALRADVGAVAPGAGTPTGSVEFRHNDVLLGTAELKDGIATLSVSFRKGSYPITASYSGDDNFNASSGAHTHTAGAPR